jgi:hypothetical protein
MSEEVVSKISISWKKPVATCVELGIKYPNPSAGDAVWIEEVGLPYVFDGSNWVGFKHFRETPPLDRALEIMGVDDDD